MESEKLVRNEAVLVEEGVDWFQNLRNQAEAEQEGQLQRLALVLHAFMLELGFCVENPKVLPENWSTPAGLISRYFHPPASGEDVLLTVTSLGPVVKVHGSHSSSKSSFSMSRLKPDEFFAEKEGNLEFKNLRRLARLFKNEVGVPLLNSVRMHLGFATTGLVGMPPEILLKMLKHLDLKSLLRVKRVSKQLHLICTERNIWKQLFVRDYGSRSFAIRRFNNTLNNQDEEDWFKLYKEEYLNKKEQEESRSRLPPPPLFPFPDFENHPQNPLMPPIPGIVGGDYDRVPFGRDPLRNPLGLPRPRFDPPGPNFPGFGPRRGGFGPPGFGGGGGFGFM